MYTLFGDALTIYFFYRPLPGIALFPWIKYTYGTNLSFFLDTKCIRELVVFPRVKSLQAVKLQSWFYLTERKQAKASVTCHTLPAAFDITVECCKHSTTT